MRRRRHHGSLVYFFRYVAPDFCWLTAKELFLMAEQIDEDIDENCFMVTLCNEARKGLFLARPWPHPTADGGGGRPPRQYLRVT